MFVYFVRGQHEIKLIIWTQSLWSIHYESGPTELVTVIRSREKVHIYIKDLTIRKFLTYHVIRIMLWLVRGAWVRMTHYVERFCIINLIYLFEHFVVLFLIWLWWLDHQRSSDLALNCRSHISLDIYISSSQTEEIRRLTTNFNNK